MTRRALLIHGLSSNATTWWRVREALEAEGWAVTSPELRGHGSAPRAERYRLADYAADLPAGPWDLVIGHSLGGAVAVLLADRAARLVLLDPVLQVPAADRDEIVASQLAELEATPEQIRRDKPHWHPRDQELKAAAVRGADPATVVRTFADNPEWDVLAEVAAIRVPTLILGGDHAVYSMLPTATADAVVAANPLVSYRVIPGAGHSLHRDRPEETLAAIRAFVAST